MHWAGRQTKEKQKARPHSKQQTTKMTKKAAPSFPPPPRLPPANMLGLGEYTDDTTMEARAVIHDLTRAALTRDGPTESRWRADFGGPAEATAASRRA